VLKSQSWGTGTSYHIAVYSGHRGGSGTTATPALILSGESKDTRALVLKNKTRKLFDRGSVETFVFSTSVVSSLLLISIEFFSYNGSRI